MVGKSLPPQKKSKEHGKTVYRDSCIRFDILNKKKFLEKKLQIKK